MSILSATIHHSYQTWEWGMERLSIRLILFYAHSDEWLFYWVRLCNSVVCYDLTDIRYNYRLYDKSSKMLWCSTHLVEYTQSRKMLHICCCPCIQEHSIRHCDHIPRSCSRSSSNHRSSVLSNRSHTALSVQSLYLQYSQGNCLK